MSWALHRVQRNGIRRESRCSSWRIAEITEEPTPGAEFRRAGLVSLVLAAVP
jgi:hypothetical protein